MPELPEVETVVRGLRAQLIGRRITALHCHFPGVLVRGPQTGSFARRPQEVQAVRRRGKLILIDFPDQFTLSVHLRMTGRFEIAELRVPRAPHTHVTARLDDGRELRFVDPRRFGRVELRRHDDLMATPFLRALGPEPFDLDAEELALGLSRRRGVLKGALLDQRLVAGLGNIYVDEILHAVGIHPRQEADRLQPAEVAALVDAMREILSAAIESGGSTIRDYRNLDGRDGSFTGRHRVFGREGAPCLGCKTPIRKIRLVGRGTHFCPRCQPRRYRRVRQGTIRRSQGDLR